jgi:undecaprenyl pyrophosphate phosphatase UppP
MPNLGALLPVFIPGFIAAAITGYLVIRWLLGYLVNHSLYVFAAYCVVLSVVTLVVSYL